jgi:hypothetical protein
MPLFTRPILLWSGFEWQNNIVESHSPYCKGGTRKRSPNTALGADDVLQVRNKICKDKE